MKRSERRAKEWVKKLDLPFEEENYALEVTKLRLQGYMTEDEFGTCIDELVSGDPDHDFVLDIIAAAAGSPRAHDVEGKLRFVASDLIDKYL